MQVLFDDELISADVGVLGVVQLHAALFNVRYGQPGPFQVAQMSVMMVMVMMIIKIEAVLSIALNCELSAQASLSQISRSAAVFGSSDSLGPRTLTCRFVWLGLRPR